MPNQLAFGPLALEGNRVSAAEATQGNKVADAVNLASVITDAAAHLGLSCDELGSVFGISKAEVSKCFGPNNPDRNRLMKHPLPMAFARQVAIAMCEATGLAVAGADAERHALADVMRSMSDYLRVMGR